MVHFLGVKVTTFSLERFTHGNLTAAPGFNVSDILGYSLGCNWALMLNRFVKVDGTTSISVLATILRLEDDS